MLASHGFSHIGVSTHNMDATIRFYQEILGFPKVVDDLTKVESGGTVRMVYFDAGAEEFIVFMEPKNVPGIPADFDTSINQALSLPRGMYHFSFKSSSLEDLEARRNGLIANGVEVSSTVDLGYAKAIFFFDPNGIQLEFCCQLRPFNASDLERHTEVRVAS
jgi:catechol 2,3-dioxygenase-like lactoylglutathione lyase family enzyme